MNATCKTVKLPGLEIANYLPFALIAGPCQIEGQDHALRMTEVLVEMTTNLGIPFIYKSSFDKANRTSGGTARGVGMEEGLCILQEVKAQFGCPLTTDIHLPHQAEPVAEVVDILQIPAFLCRQTDLLVAAGRTGRAVNIKKGQFLSPGDMAHAAAKVASTGNKQILMTERGTSFGYNNLVVDFRSLPIMAATGYPVIFDATHSVQLPGGAEGASSGQREFVAPLARAALAVGVAGLFIECHDDPQNAPSDGANMLDLKALDALLPQLSELDQLSKRL